MNIATRLAKTAWWVLLDNAEDLVSIIAVPWAVGQISGQVVEKYGIVGSKWLFSTLMANKAIDGAILGGVNTFDNSGSKFALRKGLPNAENKRTLAIENEPHVLDGFDGVIVSGYGKGTKRIVYKGQAVLKVKGEAKITDVEYHMHQADRAGLHYDLAIAGLKSGEELFELHIGKGPVKGRYYFVQTDRGYIVGEMKDQGVVYAKPTYNLKDESFINKIDDDPALRAGYIVERKMDGSLGNVLIRDNRAVIRSHRDGAKTYYDQLPSIEFLNNKSSFYLSRRLFPGPKLEGTVIQVELVHEDGVSVVSGILNSSPDNAVKVQSKIGDVAPYAWDIIKLRGRDISNKPYEIRRAMLEEVIKEIRLFNKNWGIVEKCPVGISVDKFYQQVINDKRGLPWSEGIVIKAKSGTKEDSWIKVKRFDLVDMEILQFNAGEGRLVNTLGALVCKDLATNNVAVVGTGFKDFERDWIWEHRDLLQGAVIKAKTFTATEESFRAPRFVEFHPDKGNNEYGLLLYSDVLSGLENRNAMISTKYALINAH